MPHFGFQSHDSHFVTEFLPHFGKLSCDEGHFGEEILPQFGFNHMITMLRQIPFHILGLCDVVAILCQRLYSVLLVDRKKLQEMRLFLL